MNLHQSISLSFPKDADERRHGREAVQFPGRVRELGGVGVQGKVCDLSIQGCRLQDTDIANGAEVWVSLGNASPRRARVVWVKGRDAGLQFYAPLTRAELRDVMLQRR